MEQSATRQLQPLTLEMNKQLIDDFLTTHFTHCQQTAAAVSPHYEQLWIHLQDLFQAGGKRLRPYITLLAYQAYSSQPIETILPAAAAQELLHLSMLVHDDIIDRDTMRYGVKNITGRYLDTYTPHIINQGDRLHFAESAAIMAGDLLISESYRLLTMTSVTTEAVLNAQRLLANAVFQVVGGELLDTESAFHPTAADPLTIAKQKTASYSFVSPLLMGATLAGAPQEQLSLLEKLGEKLGVAYQLRDDILGVFGNEQTTGKSVDGDIKEGKQTLLIQVFNEYASPQQKEAFSANFGKPDADIGAARSLLEESGAREKIETLITEHQSQIESIITLLSIDSTYKAALTKLAALSLNRER